MSILEAVGNSCICEGKGLTPQAPAPNFSSLMGYVLQLEQKLTLLFKLVFSVLYHKTKPNNNNKTIKPSRPTRGSHRTAQAGQVRCGCSHGALRKGPATCGSPAGEHREESRGSAPARGPACTWPHYLFCFQQKPNGNSLVLLRKAPLPSGPKWFHPCDSEGKRGVSPIVSRGLALFCSSHGVLKN